MWVDTHCHLDAAEFAADRAAVYARAVQRGMAACVVPAVAGNTFADVAACCQTHPLCRPAYGIHPMYVDRAESGDVEILAHWLDQHPAVAIGEIGLDGTVVEQPGLEMARQLAFFRPQLRLAAARGLPVILHGRRAIDLICRELRQETGLPGGIAHAFNGSRQQADILIGLGFKLGFGGAMTYAGSTRIRQLAKELPLSAIVLETDAPDIPPAWLDHGGVRGRNEPGELPGIARVLAGLRGLAVEEVLQQCAANAREVLPGLAGI